MRGWTANAQKLLPITMVALVFMGCDQIARVTGGAGGEKTTSEESASADSDPAPGGGEDAQEGDDTDASAAADDDASNDDADTADEADPDENTDSEEAAESAEADDRNVEQYPRLPRNVTWKPISSSSGDNLTVVLWGNGGGEKNYEEGSLRVEHDDGVKYPRTYVRRDDPDNGERAPKFYFDVQGGWFVGKNPVLIWNLGAYRVVHPDRRQGKHEDPD